MSIAKALREQDLVVRKIVDIANSINFQEWPDIPEVEMYKLIKLKNEIILHCNEIRGIYQFEGQ